MTTAKRGVPTAAGKPDAVFVRAPGSWPLLGHAVAMLRDPYAFLRSLPAHGDLVEIGIGPLHATVVCDPDLTHEVLLSDRIFDKGGPLFVRAREVVGSGLATCPHAEHRRLRRLIQPAFHPSRIRAYSTVMAEQIGVMTGRWRDGGEIDVLDNTLHVASRTTAAALFSNVLAAPALADTLADLKTLMAGLYPRMIMPPMLDWLPIPGKRRYDRARARLRSTIDAVIDDYRTSGVDHGDILSSMLAGDDSQPLTQQELNDALVSVYIAGTDTTAKVVAWALHHVALNPAVERTLHQEVDAILAGRAATHADIGRLEVTGRIMAETLRMWPPGWFLTRTVTADITLGGHHFPAGSTLVISPYVVHHRADLFPDPERFDPDRWLDSRALTVPRNDLVFFGAGPRKCIGDIFAVAEATLELATIAAGWQLRHVPGTTAKPALSGILGPSGLRMHTHRRAPTVLAKGEPR